MKIEKVHTSEQKHKITFTHANRLKGVNMHIHKQSRVHTRNRANTRKHTRADHKTKCAYKGEHTHVYPRTRTNRGHTQTNAHARVQMIVCYVVNIDEKKEWTEDGALWHTR